MIPEVLNNPLIAWTLHGMMSAKHGRVYRASAIRHKINEHGASVFDRSYGDPHASYLTIDEAFEALAREVKA